MKVVFRVDASLRIGTGHIMRCLTLADALAARGADCQFICRAHEGNLIDFICEKGYVTHTLPQIHTEKHIFKGINLFHRQWLGATQEQDADACRKILASLRVDWLIVDHYAIDIAWERALQQHYCKLMVIDDLADRLHSCDVLVDQTFGRDKADYYPFLTRSCRILCGAEYALLRSEFADLRGYSLQRRVRPSMRALLITMGGVDNGNATGRILQALQGCPLPEDCRITVVMGQTAPWLKDVRERAKSMFWPTQVLVGVRNMASLMAESDLAIGAAGATSWERCCLGLPTLMLVQAENQMKVAHGLEQAGAAKLINTTESCDLQLRSLISVLINEPTMLMHMSRNASCIVDGNGANAVIYEMRSMS